jgi:SAM-dependent methyltransferase
MLFLRDRGYEVVGIDQNERLLKKLRDDFGLETHAGCLEDVGLPEASFDVVTIWWVLEHTHGPIIVLKEAHRVLRSKGKVVVGLQNSASLGRLFFGAHWHHLDLPGHLYQFEPDTLIASLSAAGFKTPRLRYDIL